MADVDRIVAALRYQQELEDANRPAFGNPNLSALLTGTSPTRGQRGRSARERSQPLSSLVRGAQTAASLGGGFLPGAGVADVLGQLPDTAGGTFPSLGQNLREGNFLDAGLQTLGAAGDVAMTTTPLTGPIGFGIGAALKAPRAWKIAKMLDLDKPLSQQIIDRTDDLQIERVISSQVPQKFIETLPGRNELDYWIDGGQDAVERGFQEEPFILLDKLYIDPQNRGQGAARKVLEEGLQDMAAEHPGMVVRLLAEPLDDLTNSDDLVRLYESVGFDVDDYHGTSGIPMSMRLPGKQSVSSAARYQQELEEAQRPARRRSIHSTQVTYGGKTVEDLYTAALLKFNRRRYLAQIRAGSSTGGWPALPELSSRDRALISKTSAEVDFWRKLMIRNHTGQEITDILNNPPNDLPEMAAFVKSLDRAKFEGVEKTGNLYKVDLPDEQIR